MQQQKYSFMIVILSINHYCYLDSFYNFYNSLVFHNCKRKIHFHNKIKNNIYIYYIYFFVISYKLNLQTKKNIYKSI